MTFKGNYTLLSLCAFLMLCSLTCNGESGPTTPEPPDYDALRPTIESFTAERNGTVIDDDIVFSGEDIDLIVQATSQAWPVSCGLSEDETVEGNLIYFFNSEPPNDIPAPGLLSQATPPENHAVWRIPNLDLYDSGEGLMYILRVTVLDECLDRQAVGNLTLRAFASQGVPIITETVMQSWVTAGSPTTEELDQNGYYEVERGDECRITITAQSRTMSDICANRGVPDGDELKYEWSGTFPDINLSFEQDSHIAITADFDIPMTVDISDTFEVECLITDECTGEMTHVVFNFIVVGTPQIISLSGTANGINLSYDPYFDNYEVIPADEVIMRATGLAMDPGLCDAKGIHPDLEWIWEETTGSTPALDPEFDPLPVPNDESAIEFVVPAALNGTRYSFKCTANDRCNGLSDSETANFLVIVPPVAEITYLLVNSIQANPAPDSGRYEVAPGDIITIRITSEAKSKSDFCEARGIDDSPPLNYYWENEWGELLVLNYEVSPEELYSDLVFVVPGNAPAIDQDMVCRVTDICNDLFTEVVVPLRVIEIVE